MLAPMITPMACLKVRSLELTRPTVNMVVAVLLCISAVAAIPVSAPLMGFFVPFSRMVRILSPATSCNALDINFSPNINNARPPRKAKIIA